MNVGDRVLVVHGLAPVNSEPAIVRGVRPDGMVVVRLRDGLGGELAVDPRMIDPAAMPSSALRPLTEPEWLVLSALVAAGTAGCIVADLEARSFTDPRPRLRSLEAADLVTKTTAKRLTPQHRYASVYRVTARGADLFRQNHRPVA